MRPLLFFFVLALAGCTTPPSSSPPAQEASQPQSLVPGYPSADEVAAQAQAKTAPAGRWSAISDFKGEPLFGNASLIEYKIGREDHPFKLQLVVFDDRQFDLKVIDQPKDWSGGSRISECMQGAAAVAGVNGGFFTPEFTPMGLMIAQGQRTGTWQTGPLLTGAVVVTSHPQILWNAEVNPQQARELIQAGPRLVDGGQAVPGLDRRKRSTRTFIANDGGHQWLFGLAHDITLSELSELLTTPGIMPAFTVNRALNLDGGHSSALYYRTNAGSERSFPGWSTVRNYLAIVPK
ncbi:phosphodiester glycosidase family protein [Prosthecobacter sp.]|uniref:phosphodiester glycosidase family protein n=1 Tax=Prosthecobacter sp. TaxID=1965333 RepID=UPI003783676A